MYSWEKALHELAALVEQREAYSEEVRILKKL